jgi:uncharacterized protein
MTQVHDIYFVVGGKYHDMDFARLELLTLLAEYPTIRAVVAPDFEDIDAIRAASWLMAYTVDIVPSAAATQAIADYVASGNRFLALHGTNSVLRIRDDGLVDAPEDVNPAWFELLGSQFKAHPPIGPFKVDIDQPSHPLAQGLRAFETIDELYISKITAPISMIMSTTFQGEATGFVDADWPEPVKSPMLHLRKHGDGEVLYYTLGHARGHYDLRSFGVKYYPHIERCSWNYPVHYEILRRCIRWAMGDPVFHTL